VQALLLFGLDAAKVVRSVTKIPRFLKDLFIYRREARSSRFPLRFGSILPILSDYGDAAGAAKGHYFHMDLWAAKAIFQRKPKEHLDVGSRVDGFVAHVLTFMDVTLVDIRTLNSAINGLEFIQADATNLEGIKDNSIDSMSSLHAIEHFGLGRYGDPIDPGACFNAMAALQRVLAPGGRLYFAVPVGVERVEFNAHRVFAPQTIISTFSELKLLSFSVINDHGDFVEDAKLEEYEMASYACGCFVFSK
jgi:SAM-dependent methyltransferase